MTLTMVLVYLSVSKVVNQDPDTEAAQWNIATFILIIHTRAFPHVTSVCQRVVEKINSTCKMRLLSVSAGGFSV